MLVISAIRVPPAHLWVLLALIAKMITVFLPEDNLADLRVEGCKADGDGYVLQICTRLIRRGLV